jgi:hypothetical protein
MSSSSKDIKNTLHYLATGLVAWEETPPDKRDRIPQALRLGMSRMYADAALSGKPVPTTLPELFKKAASPIKSWWEPAKTLSTIPDNATLIEDGLVSDFAREWALSGKDSIHQNQELILVELKEFCDRYQLEESYRKARELIVTQPALKLVQLRKKLDTKELAKVRDFFKLDDKGFYRAVTDLFGGIEYRLCPRCGYFQRLWEGEYLCRKKSCELIVRKQKLKNIRIIPAQGINDWVAVTPGVHRYGTIPGIWELYLRDKLVELGAKVTLYPQIDRYDLLVELPTQRWAIDVKDWSYVSEERLSKVKCQPNVDATFVVFPDENDLNIPAIRKRKKFQPQALKGLQLRTIGEIIKAAKEIV